jgi:hypothetical protein
MVLQYFGSDKDIFSFTRNAKTFVLATVILMLVLRLLTVLLEHSGRLMTMIPWKISVPYYRRNTSSQRRGASSTGAMYRVPQADLRR